MDATMDPDRRTYRGGVKPNTPTEERTSAEEAAPNVHTGDPEHPTEEVTMHVV